MIGAELLPMVETVEMLRGQGFGVCRLMPGEKSPGYLRWTCRSLEAEDFLAYPDANCGILGGRASGDAVILDFDNQAIRAAALAKLPPTMTDGRDSTGPSHWYYRLTDIPPWAVAERHVAGGLGGPKIFHFNDVNKKPIGFDFLGTGAQAVCPPSLHHSGERRRWYSGPEAILTLPYRELWRIAKALAVQFGAANADRETVCPPPETCEYTVDTGRQILRVKAAPDAATRAVAYLKKLPAAVSGQGGHGATLYAARVLVRGFCLSVDEAAALLQSNYNDRCRPPWTAGELAHKCAEAKAVPFNKPWGWLLDQEQAGASKPAARKSGVYRGRRPGHAVLRCTVEV
jgi:hypothetical protein